MQTFNEKTANSFTPDPKTVELEKKFQPFLDELEKQQALEEKENANQEAPALKSMNNFDLADIPGKTVSQFFEENGYCVFEASYKGKDMTVSLFTKDKGVLYQFMLDRKTLETTSIYLAAYKITDDYEKPIIIDFAKPILNNEAQAMNEAKKLLA